MASPCLALILLTALDPGIAFVLENAKPSIKWPTEYHMKGEETNILTGIIKPFEIWYSAQINKSRIDYYGGTVRHFYIGESDLESGQEYIILPVTTEEVTNEHICKEEELQGEQRNFMPPSGGYTFEGQKSYNKRVVDVWKYLDTEGEESKTEKTLYVYQDNGVSIPVLREIKSHNLWKGTVDTHSVSRYYDFTEPQDKDLDHSLEAACNDTIAISSTDFSFDIEEAYRSYIIHHNKKYGDDEHELRKKIFKENWRRVVQHNQQNLGYKLTLNKFSDRTDEELALLTATRPSPKVVGSVPFPHSEEEVKQLARDLPESYDMRVEGVISSVKNQADCGSCWAFSTTAAVEGALARSNGGRDLDLSEQSMVDCAWGFENMGCSGGTIDGAYRYILKHGHPTDMEYGQYLSEEGYCKLENMTKLYSIRGFAAVPPLSVDAMKVALYKYGPVTVAINANNKVTSYSNGIFYDPECNDDGPNHGVTVVGYGVRDGALYWIVKNSWGEDWGQDGYILFSATGNNCHILENAVYPVV